MSMSNHKFCSSCGTEILSEAKFCPSCGQQFGGELKSSKPIKKAGGLRSIVIVFGGALAAVFGVIWIGSIDQRQQVQTEIRSNQLSNQIADENVRKAIDDLEAYALKIRSQKLFEDIRELRLEYEEVKDDPVKLEKHFRKVELMRNDIKNGRY
jgi:hypothetical protein